MIHYDIAPSDLINQIKKTKASWIRRARARTTVYAKAKKYTGLSEFWGEIKEVYIDLQHEKCAYCEMKLAGKEYASKVHEVEHFRPKSNVKAWPGGVLRLASYSAPCVTGTASHIGYYALAYNPFNYAIACTRCNSSLKSNYFPVKGRRKFHEEDAGKYRDEEPLLIYPISTIDTDPGTLITFEGVKATPIHKAGYAYERARVTIDFFDLNHDDLKNRRAEVVAELYIALKARENATDPAEIAELTEYAQVCISPKSGFSACARAYYNLFHNDRPSALALGREAFELRPR